MSPRQPPFRFALTLVALGLVPALLLVAFAAAGVLPGVRETTDFRVFYIAAGAVAHGRSPYPEQVALLTWAGGAQHAYAYPPLFAALTAPFTLLSYHAAAVVWVLLSSAAVGLALWLLGVRDWRCYGAVFLWPSTLTAISIGTVSALLLLGVAAVWRLRDRWRAAGAVAALVVVTKLFLWPIVPWLWLTGRRKAAACAVVTAAVASVFAWWWIGFAGLRSYSTLLARLTTVEAPFGFAPAWHVAGYVGLTIAATVCAAVGFRLRFREQALLRVAALTALLLTPILWLHYLVLLVVALPRRFSWLWLVPALLWITPQQGAYGSTWRVALVASVVAMVGLLAGRTTEQPVAVWPRRQRTALTAVQRATM
jgi:hypothetical protein